MKILKYDIKKFNFAELIESLYDVPLHKLDSQDPKKNLGLGTDTHTSLHKIFYRELDKPGGWPEFEKTYKNFVKEVIFPLFTDDVLIYQATPGIRFCRPGAKAVYTWHCDGDDMHHHPQGEINVYLPITDAYNSNTMWVESLPGLGDFSPININYGEFFMGYLNQCRHGNKTNVTNQTRVSFDFRVMPGFAYKEFDKLTCTTQQSFKVGQYYDKIDREKKK